MYGLAEMMVEHDWKLAREERVVTDHRANGKSVSVAKAANKAKKKVAAREQAGKTSTASKASGGKGRKKSTARKKTAKGSAR
jgi:hypothetical protein